MSEVWSDCIGQITVGIVGFRSAWWGRVGQGREQTTRTDGGEGHETVRDSRGELYQENRRGKERYGRERERERERELTL